MWVIGVAKVIKEENVEIMTKRKDNNTVTGVIWFNEKKKEKKKVVI